MCVELIRRLGAPARHDGTRFVVDPTGEPRSRISSALGSRIRPTACFGAAVLARTRRAEFPLPGGDAFCERPIDLHLTAMARAGASIIRSNDVIEAALEGARPRAFTLSLDTPYGPSLGATVTAIFLATLAGGTSVLEDVSVEPEVLHTIEFLNKAGAKIALHSDRRIEIVGVQELDHADYVVPADRLEAGTLAIAGAITGGRVVLVGASRDDLTPGFLDSMEAIGMRFVEQPSGLCVDCADNLLATSVITGPHPGFPTDLQPQATTLLTQARGTGKVVELVYRQRATHVAGLREFGARVEENGNTLTIRGSNRLSAADVEGWDIRCATALLLAALAADGDSLISGIHHLSRGYEFLVPKLVGLGARILDFSTRG